MDSKRIEIDRLKIADFYFVFPHLISSVSLPRAKGSSALRKEAKAFDVPYENLPSIKILFSEMGDFQLQALDILRAKEIVNLSESGWLSVGQSFEEKAILSLVTDNSFSSKEFYRMLIRVLSQCDLHGANGLKKKTGLMEYRYDAI